MLIGVYSCSFVVEPHCSGLVIAQKQKTLPPGRSWPTSQWHAEPLTGLLALLDTRPAGLTGEEVAHRQREFGPNRVTAQRGTPARLKFLQQFNQPLVYILLFASGVTAFLGEWVDPCALSVDGPPSPIRV